MTRETTTIEVGARTVGSFSVIDLEQRLLALRPNYHVGEILERSLETEKIGPITYRPMQYYVYVWPR